MTTGDIMMDRCDDDEMQMLNKAYFYKVVLEYAPEWFLIDCSHSYR